MDITAQQAEALGFVETHHIKGLWYIGMPSGDDLMIRFDGARIDGFIAVEPFSERVDAAALLQQRLAERGLRHNHKANSILFYHVLELFPMDNYDLNEYAIDAAIHATAAQRTIAAVLAAQEATK